MTIGLERPKPIHLGIDEMSDTVFLTVFVIILLVLAVLATK